MKFSIFVLYMVLAGAAAMSFFWTVTSILVITFASYLPVMLSWWQIVGLASNIFLIINGIHHYLAVKNEGRGLWLSTN